MDEDLEPSLRNVIGQTTLKWIFVGGKGGVGKTTCSCSLAVQLAEVRRSVLIISTDPAHNISDAFAQKFGKTPTLVNGFQNLYAMEIDASLGTDSSAQMASASNVAEGGVEFDIFDMFGMGRQVLQELAGGLPGIDEAMSFSQMIKLIQSMDFEVVVFDTAPTGHTLRLLHFPDIIENTLGKFLNLQSSFAPLISQMGGMLGLGEVSADETANKMRETLDIVKRINAQFKNPVSFALQLLINIDTHNVVVNQLLFPEEDENGHIKCKKCNARYSIQNKYLEQIADLYEDFNVTKLPLLDNEVRGADQIRRFSAYLLDPYDPRKHPSGL
uniref:ATPase ASNA1 homolog n=1 Tax=Ascaris lumbricoides TaxID=6252 RepID=A0A0M3IER3_ASCLU